MKAMTKGQRNFNLNKLFVESVDRGIYKLVEKLLKINEVNKSNVIDVNFSDGKEAPLIIAIRNQDFYMANLILDYDPNVNVVSSKRKMTPLMFACKMKDADLLVRRLLTAGINVDAQDIDGNTAVMYAVGHQNDAAAKLLLNGYGDPKIKADPTIENYSGMTALDFVSPKSNELKELILNAQRAWYKSEESIDQPNNETVNILTECYDFASSNGYYDIASDLNDLGAKTEKERSIEQKTTSTKTSDGGKAD